jgi:hypothetical protein
MLASASGVELDSASGEVSGPTWEVLSGLALDSRLYH